MPWRNEMRIMDNDDLPEGSIVAMLPMVMDPFEQALRTLEAHYEDKMGWNAKPVIFWISGLANDGVVMASADVFPEFVYMNPAEGLPIYVEALVNPNLAALGNMAKDQIKRSLPPGLPFMGAGVMFEVWAVEGPAHLDVPPSKHPDRKEVRAGLFVATDGRIMAIERERGKAPEFMELDMVGGPIMLGRFVDCMRRLCDIVEQLSHEN
jgi:hypothetical protein